MAHAGGIVQFLTSDPEASFYWCIKTLLDKDRAILRELLTYTTDKFIIRLNTHGWMNSRAFPNPLKLLIRAAEIKTKNRQT
jgi:hypothetical protein